LLRFDLPLATSSLANQLNSNGENHISKKAAENHTKASAH
jgi:hypothetical protein